MSGNNVQVIIAVVSFYFFTSISVVFLNKLIFSGVWVDAPLFLTWIQLLVASCMTPLLAKLAPYSPFFCKWEYNKDIAIKILPLTIIFIGMIAFNNLCLKYVEVTFYQVARSLTILFQILLAYVILGEKTRYNVLGIKGPPTYT